MSSPFPGMDPYLEDPAIWPDLHDALAGEIRNELNQTLPSPYYARLEMRPELGIIAGGGVRQRIFQDVTVVRHPRLSAVVETPGVATLERPRRAVSRSIGLKIRTDRIRHHFIEIRDPAQGHKLITLIEIVSPSNKRPGPDRDLYESKQGEVLESDANLIEIDLLRGGRRILPTSQLEGLVQALDPSPTYLVLVNRAWWRDGTGDEYQVFPVEQREWLPCILVPLKQGEEEVPLDLQFVFNRAYDTGPYRRGAVEPN